MKKGLFHHFVILAVVLLFFAGVTESPADRDILFRENFENLDRWNALTFPRIESHTRYSIVREGETSLLKAESRGSASALVQNREFNVYESPVVRWRWKVDLFSVMAAPTEKAGDDYPIRLYVMFAYDPHRATLGERLKYGAARAVYGEYPPHSTLNYVWTGHDVPDPFIVSPYTDKSRIVILPRGGYSAGRWVEESINVIDDYRRAFGADPPAVDRDNERH